MKLLLKDSDRRFSSLLFKVMAFLGAAFTILLVLFFGGAFRQGVFEPTQPVRFYAYSGADLKVGMPVRFRAFAIGSVTRFSLQEDGHVDVSADIHTRYIKFLRETSAARIAREGVIGSSYIALDTPDLDAKPLKSNAYLALQPAADFEQIAKELKAQVEPVIVQMSETAQRLNDPQGDLHQTLANLRQFSAGLDETRQKIDTLLVNSNRLLDHDVRQTVRTVNQQLPHLLTELDATVVATRQSTEILQKTLTQTAPHAAPIARQADRLLQNSNETLDAVRGAWPIQPLLPSQNGVLLEHDSHD